MASYLLGMTSVLINTNVWVDMVGAEKGSETLAVIERLQDSGAIRLLLPEVIVEEWKTHSAAKLAQPETEYRQKLLKTLPQSVAASLHDEVRVQRRAMEEIAGRVEIFFSKATEIKLVRSVESHVMSLFRKKLAPFHANEKSNNDDLLHFPTVRWCRQHGVASLCFVTINKSDFADPSDRNALHPDLEVDGLEVVYFPHIGLFLKTNGAFDADRDTARAPDPSDAPVYVRHASIGKNLVEKWSVAYTY